MRHTHKRSRSDNIQFLPDEKMQRVEQYNDCLLLTGHGNETRLQSKLVTSLNAPQTIHIALNSAENDLYRSQEVEPSTEGTRKYQIATATYQNNRASLVRPLTVQPKSLSHHIHHDRNLHLCNAPHTHTHTEDATERDNLQFLHDERMSYAQQRNHTQLESRLVTSVTVHQNSASLRNRRQETTSYSRSLRGRSTLAGSALLPTER